MKSIGIVQISLLIAVLFCIRSYQATVPEDTKYHVEFIDNIDVFDTLPITLLEGREIIDMIGASDHEYTCVMPQTKTDSETSRIVHSQQDLDEIFNKLGEALGNACVSLSTGWWTYEYCHHNSRIVQYHPDNDNTISYIMGSGKVVPDQHFPMQVSEFSSPEGGQLVPYINLFFNAGTPCDVTGELRSTEVRFYCNPDKTAVSAIREPKSCTYLLLIGVAPLCNIPVLRPSGMKSSEPITCYRRK